MLPNRHLNSQCVSNHLVLSILTDPRSGRIECCLWDWDTQEVAVGLGLELGYSQGQGSGWRIERDFPDGQLVTGKHIGLRFMSDLMLGLDQKVSTKDMAIESRGGGLSKSKSKGKG